MTVTTFDTEFVPSTDPNDEAVGEFFIDLTGDLETDELHLHLVSEGWAGMTLRGEDGVDMLTVYGDKPAPADGVVQFSYTEEDERRYREMVKREEERYMTTPNQAVSIEYIQLQRRTA